VTLALAAVAALLSLAVALVSIRAWRESADQARAFGEKERELASRLEAAERAADRAAAQAEAASRLLLEKGIADEEDLEAIERPVEPSGAGHPPASRGGPTVH
jgi:hypothetical protein